MAAKREKTEEIVGRASKAYADLVNELVRLRLRSKQDGEAMIARYEDQLNTICISLDDALQEEKTNDNENDDRENSERGGGGQ